MSLECHVQPGAVIGIEPRSVVGPHIVGIEVWSPRKQRPVLRAKAIVPCVFHVADVDPVHEAGIGGESRADIAVDGFVVHMRAGVGDVGSGSRTRLVAAVRILGRAFHDLKTSRPVGIELQPRIDPADAVKFICPGPLPIGVDQAHRGLLEDVAIHPRDGERSPVAGQRAIRGHAVARRAVVRGEKPQRIRAGFSGQADAELRIANVPGKHQVNRSLEVVGVFDEEGPLLREIHLEALVDGDLRLVRFHLAEIRVGGDVEHQVVMQDELGVQSAAKVRRAVVKGRRQRIARVQRMKRTHHPVRDELHVSSRRNALQPFRRRGLAESPFHAPRNLRPEIVFILPQNAAVEISPQV